MVIKKDFGVFFSSAPASAVMYYMMILIGQQCLLIDGAVYAVSLQMSSNMELRVDVVGHPSAHPTIESQNLQFVLFRRSSHCSILIEVAAEKLISFSGYLCFAVLLA